METTAASPTAAEAFQKFYLAELDVRVQRSEVIGAITLNKGSAALFFDAASGKFTLVEKLQGVEEAHVYDCEPREQWGRTIMLFGHATHTGSFVPSGHGTLDGNIVLAKLASGTFYRLTVDPAQTCLQPFVSAEPLPPRNNAKARKPGARERGAKERKPRPADLAQAAGPGSDVAPGADEQENEDLTEEDLRRLRGEIPLTGKPKKKSGNQPFRQHKHQR